MAKQTKFELAISDSLDGDLKTDALHFIAFARENKLQITSQSRYGGDKTGMKATLRCRGKGICNIYLSKDSFNVQPRANYSSEFDAHISGLGLENALLNNVEKCHRCNNNTCLAQTGQSKDLFHGFTKIIFGKEVKNTCKHGNLMFYCPDDKDFACIREIVLYTKHFYEC